MVILSHSSAETDCFPECHMVEHPVWPCCPDAGKGVICRRERRAQKIVLRIPVAEITAKKHAKYHARIARREVCRASNAAATGVSARATAIAPQITLRREAAELVQT